jgi:lipoate-protein ligase A
VSRLMPALTMPLKTNDAIFLYGARQPLPFVYTYCPDVIEVIHGPACDPAGEIELERCADEQVPVKPRRGGGGVVVLAPGMVVTIVVGPRHARENATDIFARIHRPLITLLCASGPSDAVIQERGVSDLAINERKICGSSLYLGRKDDLFFYQSSLLVSADTTLFDRYLRQPNRVPDYRGGRGHSDFCTTLHAEGWEVSANDTAALIGRNLRDLLIKTALSEYR